MWHTTDETPREGAKVVLLNPFGARDGYYRGGIISRGNMQWDIVSFTHWAYAPGEVAECEHRRRRVDDELPQHGALVVAGHDDDYDPSLVTWNEGGEGWEGQNGSFRRKSGFDWWAPIAPGEAEHASE